MSEWIRHRGSNRMPKCLEGKQFEVRYRNGKTRREPNVMGWHHDKHPLDVMAYRITGDINLPDYSKGFPVGTTAKDIGAKVGDEFVSLVSNSVANKGDIIKLAEDDRTTLPYFSRDGAMSHGDFVCMEFSQLAPIPPKTAIELQAEEVGIPKPVQEWPEERIDNIERNGGDGLHYDAESLTLRDIAPALAEIGAAIKLEDAKPSKYQRTIKGVTVDVYDVLAAFGVTCQARGHAIKKLLMAGQRGHKDEAQDLREAVQAIERSIELIGK